MKVITNDLKFLGFCEEMMLLIGLNSLPFFLSVLLRKRKVTLCRSATVLCVSKRGKG